MESVYISMFCIFWKAQANSICRCRCRINVNEDLFILPPSSFLFSFAYAYLHRIYIVAGWSAIFVLSIFVIVISGFASWFIKFALSERAICCSLPLLVFLPLVQLVVFKGRATGER